MEQTSTNKQVLLKGLKYLAYTIVLIGTSTLLITQAYKNEGHQWFWPVFIVGLILLIASITVGFLGIKTVMKAIFEGDKKTL